MEKNEIGFLVLLERCLGVESQKVNKNHRLRIQDELLLNVCGGGVGLLKYLNKIPPLA